MEVNAGLLVGSTKNAGAIRRGLAALSLAVIALSSFTVQARGPEVKVDGDEVALTQLPKEARDAHTRILSGGPFPYDKDGTVFGNRERLLPGKARGYYREYTVKTPGARNRGARRIVCGGKPPTQPDICYYTADHYASFQRIKP